MTTWTKSKGVLNDHLLVLRTCPSNIGPGPLCLFSLHSAAAAWGLEATQNWSDEHLRFAQEDHSLGRRGGLQISGFPKPGAVSLAGPLAGREVAREPACLTVKKQGFALCFSPTNIYLWCFGCERGIKDTIYILNIASFRVCKSLTLSWSSGWNMNMDERGVKLPRIHSHPHTPVVHKHGNEQASTCRRWLGSKWGKNQFHLPPIACTLFLSWVNLGEQSSRESMGKRVVVYKVTIEFRSRTYIIQSWRCSLISLMTGLLWQGLEKFHWSQRSRFLPETSAAPVLAGSFRPVRPGCVEDIGAHRALLSRWQHRAIFRSARLEYFGDPFLGILFIVFDGISGDFANQKLQFNGFYWNIILFGG